MDNSKLFREIFICLYYDKQQTSCKNKKEHHNKIYRIDLILVWKMK